MSNSIGHTFRITSFGESHGRCVGVIVDGCPAGLAITPSQIQIELDRRRPGLEILSGHQLRHGEAVALGMIVASRISNSLGLIPNQDIERQRILLEVLGFNMTPPKLDSTKIVEIMYRDKKTVGESIRFVLPTGIGRTPILRPVSNRLITQFLEDEGYG